MKDKNYKDMARKSFTDSSSVIKVLNFTNNGKPANIIFLSIAIAIIGYLTSSFKTFYNFDFIEVIVFLLCILLFFSIFYLLDKRNILSKIEVFLFDSQKKKYGNILGLACSNTLLFLLLSCIINLRTAILFEPYFLYLYGIAYIYFNVQFLNHTSIRKNQNSNYFKKINKLKLIFSFFFFMSLICYLLTAQRDPLYLTSIFCFSPFLLVSFFIKKIESLCLMYRTAFFILFFFISTTIFPFFFIIGILCIWLGKFYYFIKYNLRYPSFYKNYDKC